MTFQATPQQQAFLDEIVQGDRHIALQARAGCGKTSTVLMAVDAIVKKDPQAEITVCAFNKAIADEVRDKLKKAGHRDWKKVQAATLHSMGNSLVKFVFRNPRIEDTKTFMIIDDLIETLDEEHAQELKSYRVLVRNLVRLAKQEGFGFFGDRQVGDVSAWYEIADHYDVNGFDDTTHCDKVVAYAQKVYQMSLDRTDVIDFDDMILLPLVKNLRVKFQRDYLFVDEAQDLSRARQALARKFLKRGGRMIIVGDDRQAIYGFSGADDNALANLVESLDAKTMPLSITWRCPKAIVDVAQGIVSDIEAAPEAPEGFVGFSPVLPEVNDRTAVLCRNTAPLLEICYDLIRSGIAAKVEGRDIGEGLVSLATRWKVKDLDDLLDRLDTYEDREVQKAMAKDREDRAEQISDKVGTLRVIISSAMGKQIHTVEGLVQEIKSIFDNDVKGCVTLATYHRSKGREWPKVVLVNHNKFCPSKWARQAWQVRQEQNLAYVAFTRAQEQLIFFNPPEEE
jgi:superfamily I DNA/RNA helicase